MDNRINEAYERLRNVHDDTGDFLKHVVEQANLVGNQTSQTLFGAAGGIVGTIGGWAFSTGFGISLGLAAPSLASLGIVAGVLTYRGHRHFQIEKAIRANKLIKGSIVEEYNALPPDAPDEVRQKIWDRYNEVTVLSTGRIGRLLGFRPESSDEQARLGEKVESDRENRSE